MKILYILFLVLSITSLFSQRPVCTATANGNWSSVPVWSCGRVPLCTDNITIPQGVVVNINSNIEYNTPACATQSMLIVISGTLTFGNGDKLSIPAPSNVVVNSTGQVIPAGGGGNSNWLKIGTTEVWSASIGSVTGAFALNNSCSIINGNPLAFSPANCGFTLLPIELLDFTATCINNGVLLNWRTASELNNDHFLLERSFNALDWDFVAEIDGNGTSSEVHRYVYYDKFSTNSIVYYRLKQVDFNGNLTTYKMIDANCGVKVKDELLFYPNPSSTELNALFTMNKAVSGAELKIMNMFGQTIKQFKIDLNEVINNVFIPIDFYSGTYQVEIISSDLYIPTKKIIVIKP